MIDDLAITERCFNFSVRIVSFCQFLYKRSSINNVIAKQLLRSGTSIGANIEEAQAGQLVKILTAIVKSAQTGKLNEQ